MTTKTAIKLATAALSVSFLAGTVHADDATTIWTKTCASCHGKDGKGSTKMGRKAGVKDYTDPKVQASFDDAKATQTIKEGLKDEAGKERMKAYGDQYSEDEIKALIAYVRAFNPK